ncbi:uncharacterized protein LOC121861154 [Homarus americanus]|uniref:uncharacterized protein LOC121861154 n=1 Tax=Homarus americanus TaxID=6706 RepID=UPI001C4549D9|nr:uncharacterized protein LOC121861154 [Homarus americanus]
MKRENTDGSKSVHCRGLPALLCLLRLLGCFPFTRVTTVGVTLVRCGQQTSVTLKRTWPLLAWSVLFAIGHVSLTTFCFIKWEILFFILTPLGVAALVFYVSFMIATCAYLYQVTNSHLLALIVIRFQDLLNNVSDVQKLFLQSSGSKLGNAGSQQPLRCINKLRLMFKGIEKTDLLVFLFVTLIMVETGYYMYLSLYHYYYLEVIRVFFSSLLRLVFICLITCFMRTLAKTLTETRRAIATHLESNDRLAYVTCPISPVDDPGTRDLSKSHHDARHLNTMGATHLRTSARGQDWSLHDLVPTSVINEAQLKTFESLLRQVETLQDRVFDYFGPPLICHFLNIVLSSIADTYFLFNFEPVFTRSCLALLANILSLVVILHGTWIMQKERDASVTWLKDELLQVEDERVLARGWWLVGDMQRTLCPKAVGCFTLDNHCFVAVGSFVATYVVILLQFTTNNTTSAFTTSHPPTTASSGL